MNEVIKNDTVSIVETDKQIFDIIHDVKVGYIKLEDNKIYFEIDSAFQSKHYASNALYLFTKYAHAVLNINELVAYIPLNNDIAKHVVEHSGFHIHEKNDKRTVYIHSSSQTKKDTLVLQPNEKVLYLAGGCFWGMERVFKVLNGVVSTKVGYANGTLISPCYEDIIRTETGYKETVRVVYDPSVVSTETILKAYFLCVDPTCENQQGEDIGTQYQSGIYYIDDSELDTIITIYKQEESKHDSFFVELKPLECFYEAEEYHQNYLLKNKDGYCHISLVDLEKVKQLNIK